MHTKECTKLQNKLLLDILKNKSSNLGSLSSWNDLPDKPFGEKAVTLVDNQTVTFNEEVGSIEGFSLEGNQVYTVIFDGVEYENLTPVNAETPDGTVLALGNVGAMGLGEDNGLPFVMVSAQGMILMLDLLGNATCTVTIITTTTKTMDSKFLPEFLQPVVETAPKIVADNVTVEGSADGAGHMGVLSMTDILIEEGKTYTLIVDGDTYAGLVPTVKTENDVTLLYMEAPSGVPRILAGLLDPSDPSSSTVTMIYFHGDNPERISYATVTLIEEGEKQIIKPGSLPEHLQFGEKTVMGDTLTWDGNTEDRYNVAGVFYHVSDVIPSLADLQKGGVLFTSQFETELTIENIINLSDYNMGTDFVLINDTIQGYMAGVALKSGATATMEGTTIVFEKAGVYFYKDDSLLTKELTINEFDGFEMIVVNKIQEKIIPMPEPIAIYKGNDETSSTIKCNKTFYELKKMSTNQLRNVVWIRGDKWLTPIGVENSDPSSIVFTFIRREGSTTYFCAITHKAGKHIEVVAYGI